MIKVTMNLDFHGLGKKVSTLATVIITNDGTGTPTRGNYDVRAVSAKGRTLRVARVEHWPRKAKPPLALLSAALQEMGYHKLT